MSKDYSVYLEYLKSTLDSRRFIHSLNVAEECVKLAEKYGYDTNTAYLSGLLHDICKNDSKEKMLQIFSEFDIILDDIQLQQQKLWHSIAGSLFIQKKFGVDDTEIIDAIRYHTTGRENMSKLEKILYLADFISSDRDFDGVEYLRENAYLGLDKAVLECFKFSVAELCGIDKPIHPDTFKGYNYIVLNKGL